MWGNSTAISGEILMSHAPFILLCPAWPKDFSEKRAFPGGAARSAKVLGLEFAEFAYEEKRGLVSEFVCGGCNP